MLFVLSPAKSLDYDTPVPDDIAAMATRPAFVPQAAELIEVLKPMSPRQVAGLMNLSDNLAQLNVARYGAWSSRFTARNSKPAALAFDGDVYGGLDAKTLSADDLAWAQDHVAILSGLYGVLRPLDRLQPYRLEMGTRLKNPKGRDLYAYWGDAIAQHLSRRLAGHATPVVVNLASQEYFHAADRPALKPRVIECVFEEGKAGSYKIVRFFAKRARGLMARYAVLHRLEHPDDLKSFDAEGYAYAPTVSSADRLVFRRKSTT